MNSMLDVYKFEKNVKRYYFFFLKLFLLYVGYLVLKFGAWIFVFDTFAIPTDSMSPTLIAGDKIVVEKLTFGARLYERIDSTVSGRNPKTTRLKGISNIDRNDVLVFNFPHPYSWSKIEFKISLVYCKRCIGLPGDTISIVNGFFRNSALSDTLGYIPAQRQLSATPEKLLANGIRRAFPFDTLQYDWTIKNFGKLYVPAAGDTIKLDTINYILYRRLVEYETGSDLQIRNGQLYLADHPIDSYVFAEDYYFTVGDNVSNSQDSRYWGFLPSKHIVGVARFILYSKSRTNGKFRWDRFLKKI